MTPMIQYLPPSAQSGAASLRAAEVVVHQDSLTVAVGSGAAKQDLLPAIAAASCAAGGGQIKNIGCYDVLATVTFLKGGDCDECTVDVLTTYEQTFIVEKNSVFPLPFAPLKKIEVQTLDSAGAPIANTTEQKLSYYSAYQKGCGGCILVP